MLFHWQYGMGTEKRTRRVGPQARAARSRRDRRDDFRASVIKKLKERVAHRCSKPDCRVLTIGPGDDPDSSASIGKAAHIAAAASGGPRFDPSMTPEQRRSFDNGIWLCSNHATEIDTDRAVFPPELLKEWKALAERRARDERGRRLPEPEDARAEVLAVLTGATPRFTRTAISNAHAATKDRLDCLDARLWVETSYMGGVTQIGIHAREDVSLQLEIPATLKDQWQSGMAELRDHGGEAPADRGTKSDGIAPVRVASRLRLSGWRRAHDWSVSS